MKKFNPVFFAISFLTIIPFKNIEFSETDIKKSIKFFPLIGFLVGIILYLFTKLPINYSVNSLIILFLWEFLNGFFHLDGLADTSDAIFSTKEDKKELFKIMKDSRIGTMGVCMIFFILLAKYISLLNILYKNPLFIVSVLTIGKFSINFLSWKLNYAKDSGLGKFICENNINQDFIFSLILSFFLTIIISFEFIVIFIINIIILYFFSLYFKKKFGGVTGDIFGFSVEIMETLTMLLIQIYYF